MQTTTTGVTAGRAGLTVGVLRETAPGERRVALTPDGVGRLVKLGYAVNVEAGAGAGAWFDDASYLEAGATVGDTEAVIAGSDILVCVQPPDSARQAALLPGRTLIGLLHLRVNPALAVAFAESKVTALSLDGLPRLLSSAQAMDVLSSQANAAGYKAALVAAEAFSGYFPMLMTAAGTMRPAKVLVLGAGVAGLQAIGTARRLGAVVTGYDVRDAARGEVLSTGAAFLDLASEGGPVSAGGAGGYARELTEAEREAQQAAMTRAIAGFDIVITTAQVPGRRPPVLVRAEAVAALAPGSVVVDLAAGPQGGNVEGVVADTTIVTDNGVTLIGAGQLPSSMAKASSFAYSRNIASLIAHLTVDGALRLDTDDEITAGLLVTRDGDVVHPAVLAAINAHGSQGEGQ
jgi:H+-translocating NAD(P) transhydrogenase subunit alpha